MNESHSHETLSAIARVTPTPSTTDPIDIQHALR